MLAGFSKANESDSNGEFRQVAELSHPESGRCMTVWTTTPGVQLYTSNYIDLVKGKAGVEYRQRQGLCLETQNFPDSIGVDEQQFPDFAKGKCFILRPDGSPYIQKTMLSFSLLK